MGSCPNEVVNKEKDRRGTLRSQHLPKGLHAPNDESMCWDFPSHPPSGEGSLASQMPHPFCEGR